jgi:hypothetical protein
MKPRIYYITSGTFFQMYQNRYSTFMYLVMVMICIERRLIFVALYSSCHADLQLSVNIFGIDRELQVPRLINTSTYCADFFAYDLGLITLNYCTAGS